MGQTQSLSCDDVIVCVCKGTDYRVRDVVDATLFRGELEPSWTQFLAGIRADEQARELDLEFDHNAIDAAAESFRYEHDLITAEETEQWLAARALTLEDFTNYFARQHWCSSIGGKIERVRVDYTSASPDVRQLFATELIFSGELDRLTTRLAWRLAALTEFGEIDADPPRIRREREAFHDRAGVTESKLDKWLEQIGHDRKWLDEMVAMEAAYNSLCEKVLTPDARQKQLATMRMPLTQFEAEVVELESLDAAKEAMLCIRQDGMSMKEVATEGRYPYRELTFLHEQVPEEFKQKFWSVAPGEILAPLPHADGFELYRIIKKREPKADDPNVQQRIDAHLLERQFSALTSKHVGMRLVAVLT
jgi:hypothetical protein